MQKSIFLKKSVVQIVLCCNNCLVLKTLLVIIIIVIGFSCSSSKKNSNVLPNRVLSLRERLVEKYRLLRIHSFKRERPRIVVDRPLSRNKSVRLTRATKVPLLKKVIRRVKKRKTNVDYVARQKEIEQNISYYCIKHDKKYDSEIECLEFAHSLLVDCEVRAIQNNSSNVVRCLKRHLHLR